MAEHKFLLLLRAIAETTVKVHIETRCIHVRKVLLLKCLYDPFTQSNAEVSF